MKKQLLTIVLLAITTLGFGQYIEEINYENPGADGNQYIEVFLPLGENSANYEVYLYDGSNGSAYDYFALDDGNYVYSTAVTGGNLYTILIDAGGIYTTIAGVALYKESTTTVIQFVSYEGSFTASDNVASGMTSTDTGLVEEDSQNPDLSMQDGDGDGTWVLAALNQDALPIDLTSFNATQRSNKVALTWTTATEINNDFFNIERSKDGQRFEVIGQVSGAGNSTTTQKYEFIDNTPLRGTNYYRLAQTDFDGRSETFDVVSVDFKGTGTATIHPTQVKNIMTLSLEPMETVGRVAIFNLVGQKVYDEAIEAGTSSMQIDAISFARGQYFARVSNGSFVETVRFIKQ